MAAVQQPPNVVQKTPTKEHPPVANMIEAAIGHLKERKGSSVAAIKKYIEANFKGIDMTRLAPHIKRHVKKSVMDGSIVQTKGKGATGSFRIGKKAKPTPKKKAVAKKTKAPKAKKTKPKKAPKAKAPKAKAPKKAKTAKPKSKSKNTKRNEKRKEVKKSMKAAKVKKSAKVKKVKKMGKKAKK